MDLLDDRTDILLVDAYGENSKFFNISKYVFLGGSLIKHGGQNPIESSRLGCKIFHGPNVSNFVEAYEYLKTLGVTKEIIGTVRDMIKNVTYNKIDLIDYLETTPEQLDELDDIINHRNDYNNKVINKLYSFLKYSGLGIFLFYIFSPSTNSYGHYYFILCI